MNPCQKNKAFVRDHLAGYRTDLASKRTFLSYLRTALAFFVGGLALIKFWGHPILTLVGWIFLFVGIIIFFQGVYNYTKVNRAILAEKEKADKAERAMD